MAASVGFTALGGNPASATALPNSCSASTSSSSAADAAAAVKASAADLSPTALRARAAAVRPAAATPPAGDAQGIDIADVNFPSSGTVTEPDWSSLQSSGVSFLAIKATEGDYYTDEPPYATGDTSKFVGYRAATAAATAAGLDVMPYVFGNPHTGNGTAVCQADYAWQEISSASPAYGSSSLMLPVVLDIEQDPYTSSTVNSCYNQTTSGMATWISQFLTEMQKDSGKTPGIYTDPSFWTDCTGGSKAFTSYPLWLAAPDQTSPPAVAGWSSPGLWQYADDVSVGGLSGVDGDYMVTQDAKAGTAVTPFQFTSFPALATGQTATFKATGLPAGLGVSTSTGVISGTPTQGGLFTVVVTRTVSNGTASSASVIWNVTDPITFPTEGSRASSTGAPTSAQITVADSNSTLSGYTPPAFTATGLPPGLSITSSGLISGWPATPGTYGVKVTATDGLGAIASASFSWVVNADADTGKAGQIRQGGGSNKCLDDPSSRTGSGTPIDLATCTGKSNQSWTFVMDGSIRVLGHCLAASGTSVVLYSCNGSVADQWRVSTDGSLVSVRYGKCLNGPSGSAANGTRPTLATCTNSTSNVRQHWSGPIAPIAAGVSRMCLTKSGASAAIGTCGTYSAQWWNDAGNAELAVQTSYCLTETSTPSVGSAVEVEKCANAAAQHWRMVAAGNIAQEIQSVVSGLCVTVPSSGTHLVLGNCSTALSSTWRVG